MVPKCNHRVLYKREEVDHWIHTWQGKECDHGDRGGAGVTH